LIVQAAIVPHAPLLTGPFGDGEPEAAARVRAAVRRLRIPDDAVVVVLSPHGRVAGLYARGAGSLRRFGHPGPELDVDVASEVARQIEERWGHGPLRDDLDHGIVVPLTLLHVDGVAVAAATLEEEGDVRTAIERGRSFARALVELESPVAFVASAHTGAALTPRAPLGLREEALEVDRRVLALLTDGTGDGDEVLNELARVGGSCGAGPLAAFAELFAGRTEVHAYECPFGVGYLVATATP
jgi:aromatic ring-opening dioxygenase LigB subunit